MIASIFRSQLRQDILTLYFTNPDRAFFLRELARKFQCSVGSLQRELTALEKEGVLTHERKGNVKLFKLNQEYPLLSEVTGILQKTIGVTILLEDITKEIEEVELAFVYGSYAKSAFHLLDTVKLFAVGKSFDSSALAEKLKILENGLKRKFDLKIMDTDDFRQAISNDDRSVMRAIKGKHVLLKGDMEGFLPSAPNISTPSPASPVEPVPSPSETPVNSAFPSN